MKFDGGDAECTFTSNFLLKLDYLSREATADECDKIVTFYQTAQMDETTESYIMLLLADGNLPTGSFVASSGLESYVKHGFFGLSSPPTSSSSSAAARSNQAMIDFIQYSLGTYARSALPFVSDAHIAMQKYRRSLNEDGGHSDEKDATLKRLKDLDDLYHCMTLNDVTRRASKAQGVALLSLFSKGFSKPDLALPASEESKSFEDDRKLLQFMDEMKLIVRKEDTHGHLPICWGILTAALGLSLERSQYLHLFLQARSLLSAAIRLNNLGPYAAQQLLLHVVKGIVETQMVLCKDLHTGLQETSVVLDDMNCAASTWPLGEILAARHDLQHSRIFNS